MATEVIWWNAACRMTFFALVLLACSVFAQETKYRAAVVEYYPYAVTQNVSRDVAWKVMKTNIDAYEVNMSCLRVPFSDFVQGYVSRAAANGVDVIVFPEYGLYGGYFPNRSYIKPYLQPLPPIGVWIQENVGLRLF